MQEHLAIPNWAWIVIGAGALYLISRLHAGRDISDGPLFQLAISTRPNEPSARQSSRRKIRWKSTVCWPSSRTTGSN